MQNPGPGRRFLFTAGAFMILLTAVFDVSLFAVSAAADAAGSGTNALPAWIPPDMAATVHVRFWTLVVPVSAALCLVATRVLWRMHRHAPALPAGKARGGNESGPRTPAPSAGHRPLPDPVAVKNRERRIFVHLLALMQREGRLFDFFAEDLKDYDDAQIGAAVRNIHQSCSRVIDSKLSPRPLMDADEGETVTVPPGLDPRAMTLTGNVVGEPPFTGVVRHRGWRLDRIDMPTLSDTEDSAILAPAEIEIQ